MKKAILLSVSLAAVLGAGQAAAAGPGTKRSYFNWSDNNITLLPYGWGYEVDLSEQSTFTFEHVHDSALGDLFLFVDAVRFHDRIAGVELDFWWNKYQIPDSPACDTDQTAASLMFEYHL